MCFSTFSFEWNPGHLHIAAGNKYSEATVAYYTAAHDALEGKVSAAEGMANLEKKLVRLAGSPLKPR